MKERKTFLKRTEDWAEKEVDILAHTIEIYHGSDSIILDKTQAKELMKLLAKFIEC